MGPAATTIARCQRGSDFSVISPSLGPSGLSSGNLTYPPIRMGDNRHSVPRLSVQLAILPPKPTERSEEHTSELQSLMRISYAVFCLKKKKKTNKIIKMNHVMM